PGRYQVEITGEAAAGSQVLGNFPIYSGLAPPETPPQEGPEEIAFTSPDAAEKRMFELVNADRARAGLAALGWDVLLAQVARRHAEDMAEHDFVAHVSPRTGNAVD